MFGESLGSFGGEEAFIDRDGDDSAAASLASLVSRADGPGGVSSLATACCMSVRMASATGSGVVSRAAGSERLP